MDSSDRKFGWGGEGGLIYQKAYLEFFCSADKLSLLLKNIDQCPSMIYNAVDINGNFYSNMKDINVYYKYIIEICYSYMGSISR